MTTQSMGRTGGCGCGGGTAAPFSNAASGSGQIYSGVRPAGGSSAAYSGGSAVRTTDQSGWTYSGSVGMERTRYFARQLVGAEDLTQDQLYLRQKLRRHNRMLHGWGIVCGARVRKGEGPCEIVVEPGYVLGPYGDEIQIESELIIDICSEDLDGNVASPCGPVDPWGSDVQVERPSGRSVYLAVAYAECLSRPVRAVSDGCGCDSTACEYSRIRDSFRIVVLDDLPSTYPGVMDPPDFSETVINCPPVVEGENCHCPSCQPCPTEPWVILADLTVEGSAIKQIECDPHRRYAASFRSYFYRCMSEPINGDHDHVRLALARSLRPQALRLFEESTGLSAPNVTLWKGNQLSVEGIEGNSALARRMKEMTIAEIARQGKEAFVQSMVAATSPARRKLVMKLAEEVWAKAADVVATISR
jgi:hypothetical protein